MGASRSSAARAPASGPGVRCTDMHRVRRAAVLLLVVAGALLLSNDPRALLAQGREQWERLMAAVRKQQLGAAMRRA